MTLAGKQHEDGRPVYRDDCTGDVLDSGLVHAARKKEFDYFISKGVWAIRTIRECVQRTGKRPISVRWIDINKSDDGTPNIRS